MSKTEQMEVLIAVYLFEDLGRKDYDAIMDLVEADAIQVQGVVLASKDEHGEMKVIEAGDHAVRKGATMLGGADSSSDSSPHRCSPPRPWAQASGRWPASSQSTGSKAGSPSSWTTRFPDGSAAVIAIYGSGDTDKVKAAIPNAIRSSVAQIDGKDAKELKAGLQQASAGLSA